MVVVCFGLLVVFGGYDFLKIIVLFFDSLMRFGLNLRKVNGFFLYFSGKVMRVCVGEIFIIVVIFF